MALSSWVLLRHLATGCSRKAELLSKIASAAAPTSPKRGVTTQVDHAVSLNCQQAGALTALQMQQAVSGKNTSHIASVFSCDLLQSGKKDETLAIFKELLHASARTGDVHVAKELLDTLKVARLPVLPWAYSSVLHAMCKRGKFQEALDFLAEQVPMFDETSRYFTAISRYASAAGRRDVVEQAAGLLNLSRAKLCDESISCLLHAAGAEGGSQHIQSKWQDVTSKGPKPGFDATCNRLFALARRAEANPEGTIMVAIPAWQDLSWRFRIKCRPFEHSSAEYRLLFKVCNATLEVAAAAGHEELAGQVMKVMRVNSMQPDAQVYTALMTLASRAGGFPDDLEDLLQEMLGRGLVPNHHHFNQLLRCYAHYGMPAEAQAVLHRSERAGCLVSMLTLQPLLFAHALAGDVQSMAYTYSLIRQRGFRPGSNVFVTLFLGVQVYADALRVEVARKLAKAGNNRMERMRSLHAERASKFAAAYTQMSVWQQDMVALGVQHTDLSIRYLIGALERINQVADIAKLADMFELQRPSDFSALAAALRTSSRQHQLEHFSAVFRFADKLRELRGTLSKRDYACLLFAQFWVYRDVKKVLELVEAMKADGHEMDCVVYSYVLNVYGSYRLWGDLLRTLDEMTSSSVPQSDGIWHVCFRSMQRFQAPPDVWAQVFGRMDPKAKRRFAMIYPAPEVVVHTPTPQSADTGPKRKTTGVLLSAEAGGGMWDWDYDMYNKVMESNVKDGAVELERGGGKRWSSDAGKDWGNGVDKG